MYSFKKSLIALVGLVALVGGLAALLPLIGRGQGGGNNPLTRDTRRLFYLTQTTHDGSQALTACASGYHMASLWETRKSVSPRMIRASVRPLLVKAGFALVRTLVTATARRGRAPATRLMGLLFLLQRKAYGLPPRA